MTDREEWGPWIEHDGKTVPVSIGTFVHLVFEDGDEWQGIEGTSGVSRTRNGNWIIPDDGDPWSWIWDHPNGEYGDRIIRYRVRKPRGLTILEDLIADLPAPVQPEGMPA